MRKFVYLGLVLGLLALLLAGAANASEATHCYIVGDSCLIISNVCYLEWIDCGDGRTWESQYHWKAGWCAAAIYAGVIVGTVDDCVNARAQTVAERVLISSIYSVSSSQYQRQQGNQQSDQGGINGSSQQGNRQPNRGGGNQPGNQQQGNEQQGSQQQGNEQQGNQGQQGNQPPQGDPPPGDPPQNDPPQNNDPPVQIVQQQLETLQQQQQEEQEQQDETQYSQQQAQGESSHCPNRSTNTEAPNCTPSTPVWRNCSATSCNCYWERTQVFSSGSGAYVCDDPDETPGSCTSGPVGGNYHGNLVTQVSSTSWAYVCHK